MSIFKEKDLESGNEPFPDYVDDSYADNPLPSEIRLPESRPFLVRSLPPRHQLLILDLQSRFLYYWHYPIPLPNRVERGQIRLQQWWSHPLEQWLPASADKSFQKWWLAPDHVWRRRRLRVILWWIAAYFVILIWGLGLDVFPPEVRRDIEGKWEERMGGGSCRLLGCVRPAWDVGRSLMMGDNSSHP